MKSILFLAACSIFATCGVFADDNTDLHSILTDETEIFSCSGCKSVIPVNYDIELSCNCKGKGKVLIAGCPCQGKPKEKAPVVTEEAAG